MLGRCCRLRLLLWCIVFVARISVAQEPAEEAVLRQIVAKYISDNKNWRAEDYVVRRSRQDGDIVVFSVIHRDDETALVPGGGKSVELHVDVLTKKVARELGFQ